MSEQLLRRALREAEAPEAGSARARALQAAMGARAERPARAWTAGLRPLAASLAALAVGLLIAFTPPGEAVADWVSRAVHARPAPKPTPAPGTLPGNGRLLVAAGGRAWVVRPDGHRTSLGRWNRVAWSPHGLFIVAWKGRSLAALDPEGHERWSVTAPARIRTAVWSPQGFHVVYLAAHTLRVVSGQGLGDSPVRRAPQPGAVSRADVGPVAPVAPAFRPGADRTLAFATAGRRIEVIDVYTGALLWRSRNRLAAGVRAIAWTGDGERLIALGRTRMQRWSADGRALPPLALPAGTRGVAIAAASHGRRLAVSVIDPATGGGQVLVMGASLTRVFQGNGRVSELLWSPEGQWLLADWQNTWLFLRPDRPNIATLANIRQRFGSAPAALGGWAR